MSTKLCDIDIDDEPIGDHSWLRPPLALKREPGVVRATSSHHSAHHQYQDCIVLISKYLHA